MVDKIPARRSSLGITRAVKHGRFGMAAALAIDVPLLAHALSNICRGRSDGFRHSRRISIISNEQGLD